MASSGQLPERTVSRTSITIICRERERERDGETERRREVRRLERGGQLVTALADLSVQRSACACAYVCVCVCVFNVWHSMPPRPTDNDKQWHNLPDVLLTTPQQCAAVPSPYTTARRRRVIQRPLTIQTGKSQAIKLSASMDRRPPLGALTLL